MYLKKVLLPISLLLTGCVERGYHVTSNIHKHTATAQSSSSITNSHVDNTHKLEKMKRAVKLALSKQTSQSIGNISQEHTTLQFTKIPSESYATDSLIFKRLDKTYQQFGNSEIHGHVIYLSATGEETRLKNTHIYLLEDSIALEKWFNESYLTNKHLYDTSKEVYYLNTTHLNLSKNFAFHGITSGDYFVIIVADTPDKDAKDQKVYIAKKIKVGERKKIMAVFSKKL